MNLAEALARADALRAEADRIVVDYATQELDALPGVTWSGPMIDHYGALSRGGASEIGLVRARVDLDSWQVSVSLKSDWNFGSAGGFGATAEEALNNAMMARTRELRRFGLA